MALSGLSLEEMVLVIPAVISAMISILAFALKHYDTRRRRAIYRAEERLRTEVIERYLKNLGVDRHPTETDALVVHKVLSTVAKVESEGVKQWQKQGR